MEETRVRSLGWKDPLKKEMAVYMDFLGGTSDLGIHLSMQETWVQSLGCEDPLKKEMAAHSSILAREIPWTEEPGGL